MLEMAPKKKILWGEDLLKGLLHHGVSLDEIVSSCMCLCI